MNTITINEHELTIKVYNNQRVVTFKDIDTAHGRPDGTARRTFNANKERFIEGEDYFVRNSYEAKNEFNAIAPNGLVLLTESGYLMLVKSFTDNLAWKVQRELVNGYFKTKEIAEVQKQIQPSENNSDEVKLIKARTKMAKMFLKLSNVETLSPEYKNILVAKSAEALAGEPVLPLPKVERKTYSATEVGKILGVSAMKIGKLANLYNLKTEEYGIWYHDKAKYCSKEVDTFRYFDEGIDKLKSLLS